MARRTQRQSRPANASSQDVFRADVYDPKSRSSIRPIGRAFEVSLFDTLPASAEKYSKKHFPGFLAPDAFEKILDTIRVDQMQVLKDMTPVNLYDCMNFILSSEAASGEKNKRGNPGVVVHLASTSGIMKTTKKRNTFEASAQK